MALTQADLDALDLAIASGALQVTDKDGRSTRYDSLAELLKRRSFVAQQLGQSAAGGQTFYVQPRTGLRGNAGASDCP